MKKNLDFNQRLEKQKDEPQSSTEKTVYRDRAMERRLGIQEPIIQKPTKFVKSNQVIVPRQAIKKDVLEAQEYLSQLYQESPIKSEYAQNIVKLATEKQQKKSKFKDQIYIYDLGFDEGYVGSEDEPKIIPKQKLRKDIISDTPVLLSVIEMLSKKIKVSEKKPEPIIDPVDDDDFDIFEDADKDYIVTVNKDKSKKIKLFEQQVKQETKPDFNDESIQRLIKQESAKQESIKQEMVLEPFEDIDYDDYSDEEEEKGKKRTKSNKKK